MSSRDQNSSQEKILYQIKRLGPQTVRRLADAMGLTTMGIRQHLDQLASEGLVKAMPEELHGRGRPVRRWKLTAAGHKRFPDAHGQVTSDLIASVRDVFGEEALDTIIEKRSRETLAHYRRELAGYPDVESRIRKLCQLRSDEGYMAEYEAGEESYLLKEHHCPICVAAESCQGFCRAELEIFRQVFEGLASVEREDHLLAGARRCTYRIVPGRHYS